MISTYALKQKLYSSTNTMEEYQIYTVTPKKTILRSIYYNKKLCNIDDFYMCTEAEIVFFNEYNGRIPDIHWAVIPKNNTKINILQQKPMQCK